MSEWSGRDHVELSREVALLKHTVPLTLRAWVQILVQLLDVCRSLQDVMR